MKQRPRGDRLVPMERPDNCLLREWCYSEDFPPALARKPIRVSGAMCFIVARHDTTFCEINWAGEIVSAYHPEYGWWVAA